MTKMKFNSLHRLWVRQLQKEFAHICLNHQVSLIPPIFEISMARKHFGSWHPDAKTMKISHYLIMDYSWDQTINVLKHEIAHMICTEIFGDKTAGHDHSFQNACEILRLPQWLRKSQSNLENHLPQRNSTNEMTTAGRHLISKIKKLLALAGSENEYEAALAMQKACNLMTSHNIKQLNQDCRDDYIYLIIPTGSKQLPTYRRTLCTILRDHFHVQVICSTLYEPLKDVNYKTIELMGRKENVTIAEHCYLFLENRLATLWQQNKDKWPGHKKTVRNSYYLGLLQGFREKLLQQSRQYEAQDKNRIAVAGSSSNLNALLINEDLHLRNFVASRFPRLRTSRRTNLKVFRDTFAEAVNTGRKINLHQAVQQKKKGEKKLLI